jgi:hypothetical protein
MADVSHPYLRRSAKSSRLEYLLQTVEQTCRVYDARITKCIIGLVAIMVWCVLASVLVKTDNIMYEPSLPSGAIEPAVMARHPEARKYHQVFRAMASACADEDAQVVVGPQMRVNGAPFMRRIMRWCPLQLNLANPRIAVAGQQRAICSDEVNGEHRQTTRAYPITVESDNQPPWTVKILEEACSVWHAVGILDNQW